MAELDEIAPPYNIEAEMAVLGSMLVERDAVVKALDVLKPDAFFKDIHRVIFEAIQHLHNSNREADVITVGEVLQNQPGFRNAGGQPVLLDLADRVPTALHVEHYARIVHEKFLLRSLISNARSLMKDAQSGKIPAN